MLGIARSVRHRRSISFSTGLRGVTGKYRKGDETDFGVTPNAVVPNFAGAVKWILQQCLAEEPAP